MNNILERRGSPTKEKGKRTTIPTQICLIFSESTTNSVKRKKIYIIMRKSRSPEQITNTGYSKQNIQQELAAELALKIGILNSCRATSHQHTPVLACFPFTMFSLCTKDGKMSPLLHCHVGESCFFSVCMCVKCFRRAVLERFQCTCLRKKWWRRKNNDHHRGVWNVTLNQCKHGLYHRKILTDIVEAEHWQQPHLYAPGASGRRRLPHLRPNQ